MTDLLREIWQTITNNKLRTALTGVAVAWGIFMLIVLMGMSHGVVNAFENNRRSQGSNILQVWGGTTTQAWHGYKEGRYIELKEGDMSQIARQNPAHVATVTAELNSQNVTMSTDHDYMTGYYSGVFPQEATQRALEMKEGRFINDIDISQRRKVMVLSEQNARSLFGTDTGVTGRNVRVGDVNFRVIGVFASEWGRTSYVPYTTAKSMSGGSDVVDRLTIVLDNVRTEADGEDAEKQARRALAANHDFRADDESAVDVWNRFTQHLQMQQGMGILETAVWVIGLFTLLSGIIGVSNIMFVSVRERTHEIGIRRAIGARPRSILTQIILESVAITLLFGYIGIVLGSAVNELIARLSEGAEFLNNPRTDLSLALSVTVVLIIAGVMAGLFPALKALKVKPVEALRDE